MHTASDRDENARLANLLGAFALEAAGALERAANERTGKGGAAAAALVHIAARPDRTVEQVRGPLGLSQPGATRLLQRLAQEGWIEIAGPGGRRGLRIHLTPAGERVLDELLLARRAALSALLEPLTAPERDQLEHLLERLLAARTTDRPTLERLCRLCERRACARCPVGSTLDALIAQHPELG